MSPWFKKQNPLTDERPGDYILSCYSTLERKSFVLSFCG